MNRIALGILIVSALLPLGRMETRPSVNAASRFATVESLVERGTFRINESTLFHRSPDKVKRHDDYLSSKPPVLPTLAAAIYFPLHHLFGLNFSEHLRILVALLTFTLVWVPHMVSLWFFWKILARVNLSAQTRNLAFAGFALGSITLGYSGTFNNHTPAGALLLIAFYYFLKTRDEKLKNKQLLTAGICLGLAPTFELTSAALSLGLFIGIALRRQPIFHVAFYASIPVLLNFALNFWASGSLLPIYLQKHLYYYPGSYWNSPTGIDTLSDPKWIYFLQMTLGHHGYWSMTPLLALSIPVLIRFRKELESQIFAIILAVVTIFFCFYSSNYGGICTGFRWMFFLIPIHFYFVARWLESDLTLKKASIFATLFLVSFFHMIDALIFPWSRSYWDLFFEKIGLGYSI